MGIIKRTSLNNSKRVSLRRTRLLIIVATCERFDCCIRKARGSRRQPQRNQCAPRGSLSQAQGAFLHGYRPKVSDNELMEARFQEPQLCHPLGEPKGSNACFFHNPQPDQLSLPAATAWQERFVKNLRTAILRSSARLLKNKCPCVGSLPHDHN